MNLSLPNIINSEISVLYPSPEKKKNSRFGYSVEALSIATLIQNQNKNLKYYDFSLSRYDEILASDDFWESGNSKNKIVFLYVDSVPLHRSSNAENATQISELIKRRCPETTIVACGSWCMLTQENFPFADITFLNEPEYDFLQMIQENEIVSASPRRPFLLQDLSLLPIPNRKLLPNKNLQDVSSNIKYSAVIQTTRGCRNGCIFCPRQAWNLRMIRHRPIEHIIAEILQLREAGIRNVWIDDDNMGADQAWSCDLFTTIAKVNKDGQIKLFISTEVNVSKEFFAKAKSAGVRIGSFGIESGSDNVLHSIKKPSNVKLLSSAINNANQAGIFTVGNFIVGLPGETLDDLSLTKQLLLELPLDEVNIKILSYVRGAPLWTTAVTKEKSLAASPCFFSCKETNTSSFTFDELVQVQRDLYESFKNSPSRIARLKAKIKLLGYPYAL